MLTHTFLVLVMMVTSHSLLSADDEKKILTALIQPGSSYIHSRVGYYQSYPTNEISVFEGYLGITKDVRNWLTVGVESHLTRFKGHQLGTEAFGLRSFARWHFLTRRRFSTYLEAGFGVSVTEDEFPPGGTQFNFTEVAGVGLTHVGFCKSTIRTGGQARKPPSHASIVQGGPCRFFSLDILENPLLPRYLRSSISFWHPGYRRLQAATFFPLSTR